MESIVRKSNLIIFFALIFVMSFHAKSQQSEVQNLENNSLQIRGLNKFESEPKLNHLKDRERIRDIKQKFKNNRQEYFFGSENSGVKFQNILVDPSDSAYSYVWEDGDWQLDQRYLYYYIGSNIEIIQEKLVAPNQWDKETKRELVISETNSLQKETNSFWKNTTKEWIVESLEEFNESGLSTEFYTKLWNDTTQKFIDGVRVTSTYENDTNLVEDLLQVWDTVLNSWSNALLIENDFNANGLIISSLEKVYDDDVQDWVNNYYIEYAYDLGELINEKWQFWDTLSGEWMNDIQIARQYNEIGDLTQQTVEVWDTINLEWLNNNKRIVDYNDFFQLESISDQIWDTDSDIWIDTTRATYSYTELGNILKYLEETWDGNTWQNFYQELYNYNRQNNLLDITIEEWNMDDQKWDNSTIIYYEYANEGYTKSRQDDYWNSNNNTWVTGFYAELDIIANALDFIEYYDKTWNDSLNTFTGGFRELTTYYSNGQTKELVIQDWDTENSEWVNDQKIYYYWTDAISSNPIIEIGEISIYPVPFENTINIDLNGISDILDIEIYNIQGQIIDKILLDKQNNTIDLTELKNGVYFIVYESNNKKFVRKIVKQ